MILLAVVHLSNKSRFSSKFFQIVNVPSKNNMLSKTSNLNEPWHDFPYEFPQIQKNKSNYGTHYSIKKIALNLQPLTTRRGSIIYYNSVNYVFNSQFLYSITDCIRKRTVDESISIKMWYSAKPLLSCCNFGVRIVPWSCDLFTFVTVNTELRFSCLRSTVELRDNAASRVQVSCLVESSVESSVESVFCSFKRSWAWFRERIPRSAVQLHGVIWSRQKASHEANFTLGM